MNKKHAALIPVVLIVVGVIFFLQNPFKSTPKEEVQLGIIEPEVSTVSAGVNVGQQAPNFALQDINGNVVKLSDFKGKVVFVNFWASWCPFCVDEMPDIQAAAQQFGDRATVLFINRGEKPQTGMSYLDNRLPVKITYPILWDPDERVSKSYILYGMPVSYILDENGVIKDRKFGPLTREEIDGKLENVLGV